MIDFMDPLDFSLAGELDPCERADYLVGQLRRAILALQSAGLNHLAIEVQEHYDQNGVQVFRLVPKTTAGAQLLQKLSQAA